MSENFQEIVAEQAREIRAQRQTIAELEEQLGKTLCELEKQNWHFENLHRDRIKAQLVMDCQDEQLKQREAEAGNLRAKLETLRKRVDDQKKKLASRKRRPLLEKIARELRRLPRNLRIDRMKKGETTPEKSVTTASPSSPLVERYDSRIAESA